MKKPSTSYPVLSDKESLQDKESSSYHTTLPQKHKLFNEDINKNQ